MSLDRLVSNTRRDLIALVVDLSSLSRQHALEDLLPFVSVGRELLARWENLYRDRSKKPYFDRVLVGEMRASLRRLDERILAVQMQFPDGLPDLGVLSQSDSWVALTEEASQIAGQMSEAP